MTPNAGAPATFRQLQARVVELESKLDRALDALRNIADMPIAPSERTGVIRNIMSVARRGMEPPKWEPMTWDARYRLLEKGEIIEAGDEYDSCRDGWRDPPRWQPVTETPMVGQPAPDPQHPAHTLYRRLLRRE